MRERLTYANVMSTIAVFLAIGLGGAYAADKITSKDLAKGSVKSKAIKNRTIVGKDVKDGSVSGADIEDGAIASSDLAPATVFTPQLLNGGENDCLWTDAASGISGLAPAIVRKDGYGQVSFEGVVASSNGPGGDGVCSGGGADAASDSTIFVLPPELRPASTVIFIDAASSAGVLVIGANGGSLGGGSSAQPGAVLSAVNGTRYLNTVTFLAADAPNSPAPRKQPTKVNLRQLR